MSQVTLTAAMRANLSSLQGTAQLMGQTQLRLSTGLKVNSAIDNPSSFFAAQGLNQNASDLSSLLDGMAQNIQAIKTASTGLDAITSLVKQAKAVIQTMVATNTAAGDTAGKAQYTAILTEIDNLGKDTSYKGTNLIAAVGKDMITQFNADNSNTLTTASVAATVAVLGLGAGAALAQGTAVADIGLLDTAVTTLQGYSAGFGNDLSIIQTRSTFSTAMVSTLTDGANQLVVADKNTEGANMLALQTSQQLGIQALSMASQANQSVLRLFQ